MEHTKIVSPNELENFADLRDSEAVIPELVATLVKHSAQDITQLRIPFGDSIGLPGMDGMVQTDAGFRQFVPKNTSYWEIGRNADAQAKATEDYKKRSGELTNEERATATFVFVTPRSKDWDISSQQRWIKRRKKDGWKELKILDGVQICDWLCEFPGLSKWLLQRLGIIKSIAGLQTPAEHWELLKSISGPGEPPLTPNIFLAGREDACRQLERLFNRESSQLLFSVESENDADDFVSAFLASRSDEAGRGHRDRCLFVSEPEAWQSFSAMREFHILVASARLDMTDSNEQLHLAARGRGHGIVIPISGYWSGGTEDVVPLRSPSRTELETALREAGFSPERAAACSGAGTGSLSVMKRFLRGLGSLPPYANWENARLLALAQMVGKWSDQNENDRKVIEDISGKAYGEWIQKAHDESLRADTPLIQRNGIWKILSRGEAWMALGPRLTDDDLSRFKSIAIQILSETDPRIGMTQQERFATVDERNRQSFSHSIRDGVTESLALLGAKGNALTSVSVGKVEGTARIVVRTILKEANWQSWASLHGELPLLAEAAPDEFLDALDLALQNPEASPFHEVFKHEGGAGMFEGGSHISGVLWALETLAWHPDYFGRATMILADLAAIDPGGTWSNRPKNSLVDIFLPWRSHSVANLGQRRVAIESILQEHPDVGWVLLLSLLPNAHGMTSGTRKPIWRTFIPPDWRETVTRGEYLDQIQVYADLSTQIAARDFRKLTQLVDRYPDLPDVAQSRILNHLSSKEVISLPDEKRFPLWEGLKDLAHKHRRYSHTQWAMSAEQVAKLEEAAERLKPQDGHVALRRLFTDRDFDLYEDNDDFEEQRKKLDQVRRDAISSILETEGPEGVVEFAKSVESPSKVGSTLGDIPNAAADELLIPAFLACEERRLSAFVGGFVWRRFWSQGLDWAKSQLKKKWTDEQKLKFLVSLPPERQTWKWAETVLTEKAGEYWRQAPINPWGMDADDLLEAAEKMTAAGNSVAAIDCLYLLAHKKVAIPIELAQKTMLDALSQDSSQRSINTHHAAEVISWLQSYVAIESEELFSIEWSYLGALNRISGGGEPVALERRLGAVPAFFVEVISSVFRSDKEELDANREVTDQQRAIARNAYTLLHGWRILPGMSSPGKLDGEKFTVWLEEVKRLTRASGHFRIAMDQLGQALAHAPADPDGFWIHRAVAAALNGRDVHSMRRAFTTGLFNKRGVHGFSHGHQEQEIASDYRGKAKALADAGFNRVADEVRTLAEQYEADAKRESRRDPFE